MNESQIFSHPARPNLVNKYFVIDQFGVEVLTHKAIRFCSRAVRLFLAPSCKCVRPLYGTFIDGFAKKALAGLYGSYDKYSYHLYYLIIFASRRMSDQGLDSIWIESLYSPSRVLSKLG